jgi:hypothetical protein
MPIDAAPTPFHRHPRSTQITAAEIVLFHHDLAMNLAMSLVVPATLREGATKVSRLKILSWSSPDLHDAHQLDMLAAQFAVVCILLRWSLRCSPECSWQWCSAVTCPSAAISPCLLGRADCG